MGKELGEAIFMRLMVGIIVVGGFTLIVRGASAAANDTQTVVYILTGLSALLGCILIGHAVFWIANRI